jgi:hypothetical protein
MHRNMLPPPPPACCSSFSHLTALHSQCKVPFKVRRTREHVTHTRHSLAPRSSTAAAFTTPPFLSSLSHPTQHDTPPPHYHGQRHGLHQARLCRHVALDFLQHAAACSPSTGNPEPSFVIPSCIAVDDSVGSASTGSAATKKGACAHSCFDCFPPASLPQSPALQVASMTSTFLSGTKLFKHRRTTATSNACPYFPPCFATNRFSSGIQFSMAKLRTGTSWSATGSAAYSSALPPPPFLAHVNPLPLLKVLAVRA